MLDKIDHHMLYMSHSDRLKAKAGGAYTFRGGSSQAKGIPPMISANRIIQTKQNSINFHNNFKPLQDSSNTHISFKGLNFSKALEPVVEKIPNNLVEFMLKMIKSTSDTQHASYIKYRKAFIETAKTDKAFRDYIGLSANQAENLSETSLITVPQKPITKRFLSVLASPITMFKDLGVWAVDTKLGKKLFPKLHSSIAKRKNFDAIIGNYKKILGSANFVQIQESAYRVNAGHSAWKENNAFIIPEDILREKMQVLKFKSVDPDKGQYSAKHMMLGNRFVSGAVYAAFLSNDAYNTTMRYSNNEQESQSQRASRAKQEAAKIGMNIYIQNILLSTFEKQINKSLVNALLVSGLTTGASEIMGRALVGRPIFPSTKENLDKMENAMQQKDGVMASIGRLIAGDKRSKKSTAQIQESIQNAQEECNCKKKESTSEANTFRGFDGFVNNKISFKGAPKTAFTFERQSLKTIMEFIEKIDKTQYQKLSEIIEKSLAKIKVINGVNVEGKSLKEILENNALSAIPVGEKDTFWKRFIDGALSPVYFVKNTVVKLFKGAKKVVKRADEEVEQGMKKTDFRAYVRERLKLPVWKNSPLSLDEKEAALYKEFAARAKDNTFEINGVKNLILTLEKRFKTLKIDPKSDEYKNLENAKELLNDLMTKTDGKNHAEYDANKVTQLNINIARAISTIFLVTDAYNLTMQYSNNDKKEAVRTAKNRAVQEGSRIASSAYIMALTHSIMSKFYNGSLLGAFATVFMTSVASDSLARAVVGVPILRKNQKELIELEEKQKESKNPIRKMLAFALGKKTN